MLESLNCCSAPSLANLLNNFEFLFNYWSVVARKRLPQRIHHQRGNTVRPPKGITAARKKVEVNFVHGLKIWNAPTIGKQGRQLTCLAVVTN
jgi:hypothetical protein